MRYYEGLPVAPTILELFDVLEAGIGALRAMPEPATASDDSDITLSVPKADSISPDALRKLLLGADLAPAEFAVLFQVSATSVQNWLTGKTGAPAWVAPGLRIFEQLSPAAKRRLLNRSKPSFSPAKAGKHPFAKLEEL